MSFDKWPEEMVLPEATDFEHGLWENHCGTTGCAAGWVNTAFGERVYNSGGGLNHIPVGSAAAEFAGLLAEELGPAAVRRFNHCITAPSFGLSDAFEHSSISTKDMAAAWARAAKRKGYVPMGRFR